MRSPIFLLVLLTVIFTLSCSKKDSSASSAATQQQFTGTRTADGAGGRFSFRFPHKEASLSFAQILFGGQDVSAPPFCFVHYDAAAQQLKLYTGPNPLDFTAGVKPGAPSGVAQNDSCRIDAAASSASDDGTELTLNLAIQFDPKMAGPRVVYRRSLDASGTDTNWQREGTWTISSK